MDPTLQAKIAEAKANGYTDEEINAYLESQDKPLVQNAPMDRSEEYLGMAQGMGGEAAKLGLELGGAYYLGKKLLGAAGKAFKGPVAPTTPPPEPMLNKAFDRRINPQGVMDRMANAGDRVKQLAMQRIVPVVPSAGIPAAAAAGGVTATGIAGGQMGAMTPEQRKAYYDNMMLGAMGGDASLAAAIMNRGQ
jgi:hypothetical protein